MMGYDGIYLSRVVNPSLVTYQQNTAALGQTAADKLIELIEHPRVTLPSLRQTAVGQVSPQPLILDQNSYGGVF